MAPWHGAARPPAVGLSFWGCLFLPSLRRCLFVGVLPERNSVKRAALGRQIARPNKTWSKMLIQSDRILL
jgi:hypothetical protein